MGENPNQIAREITAERDQLGRNLDELEVQVRQFTDWRTYYRNHPKLLLGIALSGGFVLGAIRGRSSRRPPPQERASRQLKDTWMSIAEVLLGMASAEAMSFVSSVAPASSSHGRPESSHAVLPSVEPDDNSRGHPGVESTSIFATAFRLMKQTVGEWLDDKAPQLGAALAYYTVFSLAPLVLLIIAIVGLIFRNDPSGAWTRITEQMSYVLDKSAVDVVQGIAQQAAQPGKTALATVIGVGLALVGAAGVFGQLQDALNTIWGVKAKPGLGIAGFIRTRFTSFAMVGGVCFLLLVSLVIESLLKGFSHWVQAMLPGGLVIAVSIYLILDFSVVVVLFAMIFKVLPDVEVRWRDVWVGSLMTAVLFLAGKWALGLYLGSGAAASAYGAASALITLLLWIYYSSQILLFGAEFTQVYANYAGAAIKPNQYAVAIGETPLSSARIQR